MIQQQKVQTDPHQLKALEALERLRAQLDQTIPKSLPEPAILQETSSSSFFHNWFSTAKETVQSTIQESMQPSLKGVYLHGGVGCGKVSVMSTVLVNKLSVGLYLSTSSSCSPCFFSLSRNPDISHEPILQ
jgi:predicted ATPase